MKQEHIMKERSITVSGVNYKVRALRLKSGKTVQEIALDNGIPWGTVQKMEQCGANPRLKTAVKFAKAYGVTLDEFVQCIVDGWR